jgi:hypothetical protein
MPDNPIADPEERRAAVHLAIGRIFRIMSRPHRKGDEVEFAQCRSIILNNSEPQSDNRPNFARSYHGIVMRGDD